MTTLQTAIHLATTDADFRDALHSDAAAALAQHDLVLRSDVLDILHDLQDVLDVPAGDLALRLELAHPDGPHWAD